MMMMMNRSISRAKPKYRRFDNILGSNRGPGYSCGIALGVDSDRLAIDDKLAILSFNSTREAAMNGIKLEHVDLELPADPYHDCNNNNNNN